MSKREEYRNLNLSNNETNNENECNEEKIKKEVRNIKNIRKLLKLRSTSWRVKVGFTEVHKGCRSYGLWVG